MKQELIVKTQPPVLDTNYEALKAHLLAELEKYDVVVTVDTVKDAKALATQLNKTKGQLDARRKQEVAAASEPIKAFDAQMRGLVTLCEDGRQKILRQVETFEAQTLKLAEELLIKLRDELYRARGIDEEFQTVTVAAKLTSLTSTGKLAKAAGDEVAAAVDRCLVLQQRTKLRLSQLENECYRAGLHSPLSREHVEGILFADEAKYQDALQNIIIRELDRQAETERLVTVAAEKKLRDEQAAVDHTAQQVAPQPEVAPEPAVAAPSGGGQASPQKLAATGKVSLCVTCTFSVEVSPTLKHEVIETELRRKLAEAGIKDSIKSIVIRSDSGQEKAA